LRTFEDFTPGDIISLGEYRVTEAEMMAFSERYDPQFFHTDPVAAKDSPYGGIIASGWLTAAIFQRMQSDSFMLDSSCMGSPGVDEIRWLKPVRAGDSLHGTNTVEAVKPSNSKPDRGAVFSQVEIYNQDDTLVMTLKTRVIYMKKVGR
jgi:acyl dehydratase